MAQLGVWDLAREVFSVKEGEQNPNTKSGTEEIAKSVNIRS